MSSRNATEMFIILDNLVSADHPYRHLDKLIDFSALSSALKSLYSSKGRRELGAETALRMLILQFMENLSDRQMERFIKENNSAKWFCKFCLAQKTPDHSFFGRFRERLGTDKLMSIFSRIRETLKSHGYIKEIFTFVDASQLISKLSNWDDRDKAIKQGLEKFNNKTAPKVAADKQARFGCKGRENYWYGYKEHVSVDMQSGLINRVSATSADVTDAKGLKDTCPDSGAVYGDKAYCVKDAVAIIKKKGCHDATIKKNNMKNKNKDKDRWLSKIRSPYERVFSKRSKRVRYRGIAKVQMQVCLTAMVHNFKRLIKLGVGELNLVPA